MPDRALVWFRRDLRVHDNPALTEAHRGHEDIVPVFVLDRRLITGEYPSGARTGFLLDSLRELREALRERGGHLVVREGAPEEELPKLARETGAGHLYFASDVSPFATGRDTRTGRALEAAGVELHPQPGTFLADDVDGPRTGDGRPFTVYTPFWRRHREVPRREVLGAPRSLRVPADLSVGRIPGLESFGLEPELSDPIPAGERAARERASKFLTSELEHYADRHDRLAGGTSGLSPAIHFGCISVRELEQRASERGGEGADAFTRQLAWRDFYAHVLLHHPGNAHRPFQRRMEELETRDDPVAFDAWREGRTGVPIVDAAMRQLRTIGWMHNRARLVVGSFLTKNLHVDYRRGEAHFMRYLLCGDKAQNNGNWQWIASVGVDPAPAFQRMFNPVLQQKRFDPDGEYVRRWVPELSGVSDKHLPEPWTMTEIDQELAGCMIGRDYPAPIVDPKREREVALQRYRDVPR